ncbi:MAG: winged helix-turn-helix domain-containing protein, partial [Gammaproteobacteria bacterium]|nr:winged helix-turn-helix domain-containing protein [Gammaproteobacteria bacterium]
MIYKFNQFTLDTDRYQLKLGDKPVSIEPLAFDLLVFLLEHKDRVVTRNELLESLWKGKVVTDAALGARLKDARKAIQDSGSTQAVIKTVHGRGYQFIAAVTEIEAGQVASTHAPQATRPALKIPDEPSIAVLPFTNLSNDPEQDFFSDGITEDIITALSKINHLFVIAKNSTFTYKGQAVDVGRVSREQGVRYVLEGSVRKSGDRVRVTAQLVDATTGYHSWAERYDRDVKDIFAVQDDITKNVTAALQVTLTEGEQARVFAAGTNSIEAWECVVRGKDLMERHVKESNFEARQLLEKAVSLDPNYATALTYLGWTHWENARYAWGGPRESSL